MTGCNDIERSCQKDPTLEGCTVTRNLGVPENEDRQNCEYTVPDHCLEPYVKSGYMFNGTQIQGNDLSCYEIKPLSDFRVTIDDISRHHLDSDYDGIACEYNDN